MQKATDQMNAWSSDFGREYTDRNPHTAEELEAAYEETWGVRRSALNEEFLGALDRSAKILEVGANAGSQLQLLQKMGFANLYGVELQPYAVELAKARTKGINLVQGTAFDLPFRSGYFDVVYTSGVLIHISPADLGSAMDEIRRCTRRYIWGYEYFHETYVNVPYRGRDDLLWKGDFAKLFCDRFPELTVVKDRMVKYVADANRDKMYLLEIRSGV